MGDHVTHMCYAGPTPPDAAQIMVALEALLRDAGLIEGENDPEAVLGEPNGPVFRPGLAAPSPDIHSYLTNGVELCGQRVFNYGPMIRDEMACPHCDMCAKDEQFDLIGTEASEGNFASDALACLQCGERSAVNDWATGDDFLIAGCGLTLWNWQWLPEVHDAVRSVMEQAAPGRDIVIGGYKI